VRLPSNDIVSAKQSLPTFSPSTPSLSRRAPASSLDLVVEPASSASFVLGRLHQPSSQRRPQDLGLSVLLSSLPLPLVRLRQPPPPPVHPTVASATDLSSSPSPACLLRQECIYLVGRNMTPAGSFGGEDCRNQGFGDDEEAGAGAAPMALPCPFPAPSSTDLTRARPPLPFVSAPRNCLY
jgi:hypothetical protein